VYQCTIYGMNFFGNSCTYLASLQKQMSKMIGGKGWFKRYNGLKQNYTNPSSSGREDTLLICYNHSISGASCTKPG